MRANIWKEPGRSVGLISSGHELLRPASNRVFQGDGAAAEGERNDRIRSVIAMNEARKRSGVAPVGWHTVTPRIVVQDVEGLVGFVRQVFGATGDVPSGRPAVISIGDSRLMISEVGARDSMTAFLYVYVADVDEAYRRAIAAGAHSLEAPSVMPYGDRRCMVKDPWGNTWQIATPASDDRA